MESNRFDSLVCYIALPPWVTGTSRSVGLTKPVTTQERGNERPLSNTLI